MSDPDSASDLLAEVHLVRATTRSAVRSSWYPMVIFGLGAIGASLVAAVRPGATALWWIVVDVVGVALVVRFYRRRTESFGVLPRHRRVWLVWIFAAVGAFLVSALVPDGLEPVAAWLLVALAYLVLAAVTSMALLAGTGAVLCVVSLLSLGTSSPVVVANLSCGMVLIGTGVMSRRAEALS